MSESAWESEWASSSEHSQGPIQFEKTEPKKASELMSLDQEIAMKSKNLSDTHKASILDSRYSGNMLEAGMSEKRSRRVMNEITGR